MRPRDEVFRRELATAGDDLYECFDRRNVLVVQTQVEVLS